MNEISHPAFKQAAMPTDLIENCKAYLGLDKNDEAEIMRFHLAVEVMAPAIVAEFYDDLRELELFGLLVSSPEMKARMKDTMVTYLCQLFSGKYGAEYAGERWRIGQIHAKLGISASQMIGSLFLLRKQISDRLMATGLLTHIPVCMTKVFVLDTQLIVDAYCEYLTARSL